MKTLYTVEMKGNGPLEIEPFGTREEAMAYIENYNSQLLFPDDLMVVEENVKTWEDFMPESVTLHYVDYRENLNNSKKELARSLKYNDWSAIEEYIDDECYYLNLILGEIRNKMEEEGMLEEYEENEDLIKDYLWEHDDSNPVKDLIRNTSDMACFYDFGMWLGAPYDKVDFSRQCAEVRKRLGIKKGEQDAAVKELVGWNTYGGYFRIYFNAEWDKLVNFQAPEDDWKQIHFNGKFAVAIFNPIEGCGGYVEMDLNVKFPFKRDNVFVSGGGERYTIESLYGMYDSWIKDFDYPEFSTVLKTRRKVEDSSVSKSVDREERFIKIYKAGGCSCGDSNMERHRDVFYKNEYPCGWHCPHCGQFWID